MGETKVRYPKRGDGSYLYVVERSSWGRTTRSLVAAESLKDAKARYGWTRERHVSISVHRATTEEVAEFEDWAIPGESS